MHYKYWPSTTISTNHKIDYRLKFQICFVIRWVDAESRNFCHTGFLANCYTQIRIWASYRSSGLYSTSCLTLFFVCQILKCIRLLVHNVLHLGLEQSKSIEYNKCFSAHYERNFIISIPLNHDHKHFFLKSWSSCRQAF